MKIWILTLEHRHGSDSTPYATEADAKAALVEWVDEYWDEEIPRYSNDQLERPSDDEAAIELYFDTVASEDFVLEEKDLPGAMPVPSVEAGRRCTDADALDQMAHLFSASEWPGSSGLEDLAGIVRKTGRKITDDPSIEWARH